MAQAAKKLTDDQMQACNDIVNKFPVYSKTALMIQPKSGKLQPLTLKKGQEQLDEVIEQQIKEKGYSRVILLKYRQGGFSTYCAGKDYRETTLTPGINKKGVNTIIVGNKEETALHIFSITKRYYDNCVPFLKPPLLKRNEKKMVFDFGKDDDGKVLTSSITVGSARDSEIGRSGTFQRAHLTEVGFWENPERAIAALFNTIPDEAGTSIVIESTANGMGTFFHSFWQESLAGNTDFIAVFIPWFVDEDYEREVPEGFLLSEEEKEYKETYGLNDRQMAWKRYKETTQGKTIDEGRAKFKQEYPANAVEAFQFSAEESFIGADVVMRARKQPQHRSHGAVIAGFDSNRDGNDRNAYICRQGANAFGLEYPILPTFPQKLKYLKDKIDGAVVLDKLFVDAGGSGIELVDALIADGYENVEVVKFGRSADDDRQYSNKKAEMHAECKAWLLNEDVQASIPDNDELQADLTAAGYSYDSDTRLLIEKKAKLKARGLKSPDGNDALILTFARKIIKKHVMARRRQSTTNKKSGPFRSLSSRR
jgi:hypothetical protein